MRPDNQRARAPGSARVPVVGACALLVVAPMVVLWAARELVGHHASMNVARPILAEHRPPEGAAPPRLAERLILVVIDGLREDASHGVPYFDRLRAAGASGVAAAHFPTISRPGYVTILTGVEPRWSGVRNNAHRREVALDSLPRRLHAAGLRSAAIADATYSFVQLFPGQFDDVHFAPWPGGLFQGTRTELTDRFPFLLILPGAVDLAGHAHGADSDEYRAAVADVAGELERVLAGVDLDRDTLFVTSDHGHTDAGGHGGLEPEVVNVPLILAGAGVRAGARIDGATLADVAPTVAALLGAPAPGHGLGRTLLPALRLDDAGARALRLADEQRIARNLAVIGSYRSHAGGALRDERLRRLAIVAGLAALAIGTLAATRRIGLVHLDRRVLALALPAFPVVFYGLLTPFGQNFSLSALPAEDDIVSWILRFGLAALAVQLAATWLVLHGRVHPRDRLAAANALTLCGLLLAFLPAGLVWAWLEHDRQAYLPGSTLQMLTPTMYVALACYVTAAGLALALELVVFVARSVDPRIRLRRLEHAAEAERLLLDEPRPAAKIGRGGAQREGVRPRQRSS